MLHHYKRDVPKRPTKGFQTDEERQAYWDARRAFELRRLVFAVTQLIDVAGIRSAFLSREAMIELLARELTTSSANRIARAALDRLGR